MAARVTASLRASAALSGYQSRVASSTASIAAPKMQAHACLAPKTRNSTTQLHGPCCGTWSISRRARRLIQRSTEVADGSVVAASGDVIAIWTPWTPNGWLCVNDWPGRTLVMGTLAR